MGDANDFSEWGPKLKIQISGPCGLLSWGWGTSGLWAAAVCLFLDLCLG